MVRSRMRMNKWMLFSNRCYSNINSNRCSNSSNSSKDHKAKNQAKELKKQPDQRVQA